MRRVNKGDCWKTWRRKVAWPNDVGSCRLYRSFSFYCGSDGAWLNTVLNSWVMEEYWSSGILGRGQTLGEQGLRLRERLWGHCHHPEANQHAGSGNSEKSANFRVSFGTPTNGWVKKMSQVSPSFSGKVTEQMGLPWTDVGIIQEKPMWGWGIERDSRMRHGMNYWM